jgi:hypothetical protein
VDLKVSEAEGHARRSVSRNARVAPW